MFIVGLTGGIGTGKSTVAHIFKSLGSPVIDADVIARAVVEPGKPAWKKIKQEFGDSILLDDGHINRSALAEMIYSDPSKRRILNKITHPYIQRTIIWEILICFLKGMQFVVLDLPLLFETNVFMDYIHKTIVVYCEKEIQLQRLTDRNQFTSEEAERRVAAQMPLEEKCRKASFVIDNNGSLEDTRIQAESIHVILRQSYAQWRIRLVFLGYVAAISAFALWIYTQSRK